jgi:hypothetical protein
MLPFLFDHTRSSSLADDRIVRLDAQGGEVRIYRSDKGTNSGGIDVPVKGQLIKHNASESAQSFVFTDKDGKTSEPQAVYIMQDGFLRRSAESVRDTALEVNDILKMTGAKGGAPNPKTSLPIDRILPPEADVTVKQAKGSETKVSPTYHDGGLAFTLVLTEKAVAAILGASADLVIRCYTNTLIDKWDQKVVNWMLDHGALQGKTFTVDGDALKREFDADDNAVQWARVVAERAMGIVHDVRAAAEAPTPAARAEAVVKLMAGRGKADPAYGDMMKVLVQLVDPMDVTADLVFNVNKEIKNNPNVHTHMMLKKDRPENKGLQQAGEAKNRFAQPSELVD